MCLKTFHLKFLDIRNHFTCGSLSHAEFQGHPGQKKSCEGQNYIPQGHKVSLRGVQGHPGQKIVPCGTF